MILPIGVTSNMLVGQRKIFSKSSLCKRVDALVVARYIANVANIMVATATKNYCNCNSV